MYELREMWFEMDGGEVARRRPAMEGRTCRWLGMISDEEHVPLALSARLLAASAFVAQRRSDRRHWLKEDCDTEYLRSGDL